jgi:hypothetical protein
MSTQGALTTFLSTIMTVLVSAVVWTTLLAGLSQLICQGVHRLRAAHTAYRSLPDRPAHYQRTVTTREHRKVA